MNNPYHFSCSGDHLRSASWSLHGFQAAACLEWKPLRGVKTPRSPGAWNVLLAGTPVCQSLSHVHHMKGTGAVHTPGHAGPPGDTNIRKGASL